MRHTRTSRVIALAAATALASAGLLSFGSTASAAPAVTKIEGTAADAAGLAPTVDAYRGLLGDPNNGNAPGARREINWDGVPDNLSSPNALPRDLFNTAPTTRGAVFSSAADSRFQVSADTDNPDHADVRFGNINPQYKNIFGTFSPQRLFTPIGTNKMSVHFFVPGTHQPATVNGFGAVFTDVDRADSTKIELYDRWGNLLWSKWVLRSQWANKGLSFLGVKTTADIYEVRITSGNTPLSQWNNDGNGRDIVVMDDFLYSEPKPLH